ncbi:GrpB family protein [Saccharopolyspora cebuensis]|uniref:GrpB family protein n=1 Tax=Saccharopolyspora cebuensis TaxID=418759 RepID=A0ABV4CD08_9PSEU
MAPDRPPTSDADLRERTVGEAPPHEAPIALAEYDPRWPGRFAGEAERIRRALGPVRVEHVGSTSVPGLCAKPVLDVLLVVADSAAERDYVPALEAAGYALRIREPDWFEHRMLTRADPAVNLHVFSAGAAEIDRMLRFRDRLRAHDADRDAYARAKRDLARRTWRHVQHYAEAKTAVVEDILGRADG